MSDADLSALARRAGIVVDWTDAAGRPRTVGAETLRTILRALELPCGTSGDVAESNSRLDRQETEIPPLIVGDADRPIPLGRAAATGARAKLNLANGDTRDLDLCERGGAWHTAPIAEIGYHRIGIGDRETMLAVAPARCFGIDDLASGARLWGLAVQLYGLRRDGDGGIGDFGGAVEIAQGIAPYGGDAVALSPIHALFGARPDHFAPYSPSSRSFLNPLHADPSLVFGAERVTRARAKSGTQQDQAESRIDWPARTREKIALFRSLFTDFATTDLSAAMPGSLAADFAAFRRDKGPALERHALFEVLDAAQVGPKNWRVWPERLRDPERAMSSTLPPEETEETRFQIFLQWLADRSLAAAQKASRGAGLRIGLIADLAVGVDPSGGEAWGRQSDMLNGLSVGAPPDLLNTLGQNWGLSAFSPRALGQRGYAPFIETLRAAMSHAGGIRIDHAMGLSRLWLVPEGAPAKDGAYLAYPLSTLLRLITLESRLHRAIIIAEDLGTVPAGFSDRLDEAGILGMCVLWFERTSARFNPPEKWRRDAAAMTSTHDLSTVAGWWRGTDIETRDALGLYGGGNGGSAERTQRVRERGELWNALTRSGCVEGRQPPSRSTAEIVAGASRFIARTPSRLALLPLEDLVGEEQQPNLPATSNEHPNWRQRQKAPAAQLLGAAKVVARLQALKSERGSG